MKAFSFTSGWFTASFGSPISSPATSPQSLALGKQGGYGQQRGGYNRGGYGQQGGYNQGGYQQRQRTPGYDPNAKYSMKKRIEYKEENYDPNEPLRLNKFLANAGICSRREADDFILAGVISVNGVVFGGVMGSVLGGVGDILKTMSLQRVYMWRE